MATQVDPQILTLSGLRHRCAQESDHFFNRQEHDPRFCYELFRRAILQRDERAWDYIYAQYQRLVTHWVERHAAFSTSGEESQFFMNRAFEKMWLGVTPQKFTTFTDLSALLRYLQMCVHSVMIDFARNKEQKLKLEAVEDHPYQQETERVTAVEDHIAAEFSRQELWRWLNQQFKDDKERYVVHGMFVLGLKPRDVQTQYPTHFSDVSEIYRTKENLLARLRRSPELADFLDAA
jgi:DNA-directed RNA polymerase specialized sigma24 family protein